MVALIAGLELNGGGIDLLGLYTLALLMNAFAMLFGTGVAMRLRTMQAGPLIQTPAFLLLFLAPVWVPYDLLTGWVQAAASVNPMTLVLDTERGFLVGDPTKVLPAFAVVTLLVGGLPPVGARRPAQRRAGRVAVYASGMADEVQEVVEGDGYSVANVDALAEGPGFRKVRRALGVTAFGVNAIELPPGFETGRHYHEEQEELYFVHRGRIQIRLNDDSEHVLGPGGLARVAAATIRQIKNVGESRPSTW